MKTKYLQLLACGLFLIACNSGNTTQQSIEIAESTGSILRYTVEYNIKEDADPKDILKLEEMFHVLFDAIPEIRSGEWGLNKSTNPKFQHYYMVSFKNEKAREIYFSHPGQQEFSKLADSVIQEKDIIDIVH